MRRLLSIVLLSVAQSVSFSSQQHINFGTNPNDYTGDTPRVWAMKDEANFNELYTKFKNAPLNAASLGVVGDGVTINTAAFQTAINSAISQKRALFIPAGTYLIDGTLTIPSFLAIYGEVSNQGYKGAGQKQTVIQTTGDFTAFQTPRLSYPQDNLPFWATYIDLSDLYIYGPQFQATATQSGSVGLDLTGSRVVRLRRVHVEGFATGFVFKNCSEIYTEDLLAQNCYTGAIFSRSPVNGGNVYDHISTHRNLQILNNTLSVLADNPRSLTVSGGEIINNLTNNVAKVQIQNCRDDVQIAFVDGVVIENQSPTAASFSADTNGFGNLVIENCNLEVNFNTPLVESFGYFDNILLLKNTLERAVTTNHCPIVWAHAPTWTTNGYLRANSIRVGGNSPNWFDAFVQNDQPQSRPENEYIPDGFEQINPDPNADHALDGIISIAGDYGFSTNSICGYGHTWWNTTTTNNVYSLLTPTLRTKGIDQIYATALVYDNGGTNVPLLNVQGWGPQGDWNLISQAKIGSYTNANTGKVFSKYGWCVSLFNPLQASTNALSAVQLFNIYGIPVGTDANASQYGIERFCVYAPRQKNAFHPLTPTHDAIPSTGLEGFLPAGKFFKNSFASNQIVAGWINTAFGQPGTFRQIPLGGEFTVKTTGPFTTQLNASYSNEGALAEITSTLPVPAYAGATVAFLVRNAVGWHVNAGSGSTIRIAGNLSSVSGYIESTTLGDSIELTAINSSEWIATKMVGVGWATH